jgi:hypothetical protein
VPNHTAANGGREGGKMKDKSVASVLARAATCVLKAEVKAKLALTRRGELELVRLLARQ